MIVLFANVLVWLSLLQAKPFHYVSSFYVQRSTKTTTTTTTTTAAITRCFSDRLKINHQVDRSLSNYIGRKLDDIDDGSNDDSVDVTLRIDETSATATKSNSGHDENSASVLIQELQNQIDWIEAIEERNKAQIDSFVDEADQWNSMDEWERELLSNKQSILRRYNELRSD